MAIVQYHLGPDVAGEPPRAGLLVAHVRVEPEHHHQQDGDDHGQGHIETARRQKLQKPVLAGQAFLA